MLSKHCIFKIMIHWNKSKLKHVADPPQSEQALVKKKEGRRSSVWEMLSWTKWVDFLTKGVLRAQCLNTYWEPPRAQKMLQIPDTKPLRQETRHSSQHKVFRKHWCLPFLTTTQSRRCNFYTAELDKSLRDHK